jgi:hypothetical protein
MSSVKINSELDNRFIKHQLYTELDQDNLKVYNYKEEHSNHGSMKIIITSNDVIIIGDYGDAIYGSFSKPSLEWLSSLDLVYFKNKCKSSEVGKDYIEWNTNEAYKNFKEYFVEFFGYTKYSDSDSDSDSGIGWDSMSDEEQMEFSVNQLSLLDTPIELEEITEYLQCKEDWVYYINDNLELIVSIFGCDYWEFLYDLGDLIDYRCILHLEGIRRAYKCINDGVNIGSDG